MRAFVSALVGAGLVGAALAADVGGAEAAVIVQDKVVVRHAPVHVAQWRRGHVETCGRTYRTYNPHTNMYVLHGHRYVCTL